MALGDLEYIKVTVPDLLGKINFFVFGPKEPKLFETYVFWKISENIFLSFVEKGREWKLLWDDNLQYKPYVWENFVDIMNN